MLLTGIVNLPKSMQILTKHFNTSHLSRIIPDVQDSCWDGSQSFTPQSADKPLDHLAEYLMQYGEDMLDSPGARRPRATTNAKAALPRVSKNLRRRDDLS